MFRRRTIWLLSSAAFVVSALTFYTLYMHLFPSKNLEEEKHDKIVQDYVNNDMNNKITELEPNIQPIEENMPTIKGNLPRISPSTVMVYQYYYEEDGKIVEESIEPPYFLIDLTRAELQEKYSDWQISSFSSQKVVMKKNIPSKRPYHFIVGVYQGYLAIFYDNNYGELELREITETPLSSLPREEQNKLKQGIGVYGEEALIRILEDYTS